MAFQCDSFHFLKRREDSRPGRVTQRTRITLAIGGGLAHQTSRIDKRIEQLETRIDQSEKNLTTRFEDSEKDITARFDELKQEVRAQRK